LWPSRETSTGEELTKRIYSFTMDSIFNAVLREASCQAGRSKELQSPEPLSEGLRC
jgi:hypothetical protein